NVTFYNASEITLGADVYVAYGCWFSAGEEIRIGNEVILGPYCVLVSADHSRQRRSYRHGPLVSAPIVIGDGCWLAANVTVTAGLSVGNGSLLAAGSVVTKDIPP